MLKTSSTLSLHHLVTEFMLIYVENLFLVSELGWCAYNFVKAN